MGVALGIVLLVLFAVFMLTADGVGDKAKAITYGIIIAVGLYLLYCLFVGGSS